MSNLELLPPFTGPLEEFPSSPEMPAGVKSVTWKDEESCFIDFRFDVQYDERDGEKLHLQILMPSDDMMEMPPKKKRPLIVYIPGSAWHRQMVYITLPRMIRIAERGWAVAIVQYRPSEVTGFPAQIEDAKSAIRFMRKNAEEYCIDPDRVVLWGDSSGGHTAVMAAITGDGLLDNGLYGEFSSAVNCVVDWFGPSDVSKMGYYPSTMDHGGADSPEGYLLGCVDVMENIDLAEKASPMYYLDNGKKAPPIIIMHGSSDEVVPFNQSCMLYEKLIELGMVVEMYKLEGAHHGYNGFNSTEAYDAVMAFVAKHGG
ncbi:MAG: alpha/beta hydrolase [Oscillospiraceae bacterium]|nr:alpha/beta hydrolase [Oscillospiraceae bacterium]